MSISNQNMRSQLWTFRTYRMKLNFKLEPIISYLESTKSMIDLKEIDIKNNFKEWDLRNTNGANEPEQFDLYVEDIMTQGHFRELLNNSIYLVIYSVFETEFKNLCELSGEHFKSNLKVNDIASRGGYVGQCKKYMEKVIKLDLDDLNNEWIKIKKHQLIRNSIAHNSGALKSVNSDLKSFIQKETGIIINQNENKIYIKKIDFLKSFITTIEEYLNDINYKVINSLESNKVQ